MRSSGGLYSAIRIPRFSILDSRLPLGRFRHRPINQEGRQMLGPLVKSTVCLSQTLMVVTLNRRFDLTHQAINFHSLRVALWVQGRSRARSCLAPNYPSPVPVRLEEL